MIADYDPGDEDTYDWSVALRHAVHLRELTRVALAKWNAGLASHDEVFRLNALADVAYDKLGPFEATAYMAWARETS